MLDQLRQKLAELEAGMQQLQRELRQKQNEIAMQNGAMAFAKELIEELEQAQPQPDPTATLAAEIPTNVAEALTEPA